MKHSFLLCILAIVCSHLGWSQEKVIELKNAHAGAHRYEARDTIYLRPGFTYKGDDKSTFVAKINRKLNLPVDYVSPPSDIREIDKTKLVGSIPGSMDVSPSGASVYQLPIEIPAGIGGVQPSISLVYNSQSGNGIAGWGFNIGGLSAITRVPKTIYSDGNASGVKNIKTDGYALDGNRLVLVNGTYGEDNAEYRTEIETFAKIISKTSSSIHNGPSLFEIQTKDGPILHYGKNSGQLKYLSLLEFSVQAWMLDMVQHPNGQTIHYEYENMPLSSVIQKITYGTNTIEFFYDQREDTIPVHYYKSKGKLDKILRNIVVKIAGQLYRNYTFHYSKDNYSRLVKISVSDEGGELFNPTVFQWEHVPDQIDAYAKETTVEKDNNSERGIDDSNDNYFAVDFNGDGLTDLVRIFNSNQYNPNNMDVVLKVAEKDEEGKTHFKVFNTHSFPYFAISNSIYSTPGGQLIGDVHGTGRQNIVIPYFKTAPNESVLYFRIISTSGVLSIWKPLYLNEMPICAMADVDNNGKSDIMYMERKKNSEGKYVLHILKLSDEWIDIPVSLTSEPKRIYTADFNADGMIDLLITTKDGYTIFWNNGGGMRNCFHEDNISSGSSFTGSYHFAEMGDFNGDGLPDFLINNISGRWHIYLSEGDGTFKKNGFDFLEENMKGIYQRNNGQVIITDLDGDGKSDIVYGISSKKLMSDFFFEKHTLSWWKSTGNDFVEVRSLEREGDFSLKSPFPSHLAAGDFQGKGKSEILFFGSDFGEEELSFFGNQTKWRYYYSESLGNNVGKIIRVTDGLNTETHLDYESLAASNRSGSDGYSSFPITGSNIPLDIVREKRVKTVAYEDTTLYMYYLPRFHLQGKGFLGFFQTVAINNAQNQKIITNSVYNSNYFYTYIREQKVQTMRSENISSVINNYSHVVHEGKRIYPYLKTQTITDHLTTLSVKNEIEEIDDYGNILKKKTTQGDWEETQTMEYINKGGWCDNKLQKLTLTKTLGEDTYSRISTFEYDTKGNPVKKTTDPGDVNQVTTEYLNLTAQGLPRTIKTTANGISRISKKEYTYSGRFTTKETNALGEETYYTWNEQKDLLISKEDRLGVTSYKYNRLGQVAEVYYPDGTMERNSSGWFSGAAPVSSSDPYYYTLSEASGQAPAYTWYNASGQEILRETFDFKSRKISVFNRYDDKGRLFRVSAPSRDSFPHVWDAEYAYDVYGRDSLMITPTGRTTTTYQGKTTKVVSPLNTVIKTLTEEGLTATVNTDGKTVSYSYYASGKPHKVSPEGGKEIFFEYDLQGNRTKLTDPDAGIVTTLYNGWGQLCEQKQNIHTNAPILTKYHYLANGLLDYQQCGDR
ncbi:FG-GAP-like repeat-containing protein, partial [Bacteroidales bacterium OttesenSCG-928-M06]|nr:FG-GAP-like repeat-containing protein [Bacteroidales bacterium OttesenSCG-928-M06]